MAMTEQGWQPVDPVSAVLGQGDRERGRLAGWLRAGPGARGVRGMGWYEPQPGVWVEPVGFGGDDTMYGPYADEIEASEAMDELGLSDDDYKIVVRP